METCVLIRRAEMADLPAITDIWRPGSTNWAAGRVFFERIPSGVSIAAWPVRQMDEDSAAMMAEQVQKEVIEGEIG